MRALIFDLDGTLVDTVYAHVLAWQQAFAEVGLNVEGWWIHRRVGMGVESFIQEIAADFGRAFGPAEMSTLGGLWDSLFRALLPAPSPLPGAVELLRSLRARQIPHGIATASRRPAIDASLAALGVATDTLVVQGHEVSRGKPEPDLFLACATRLRVRPEQCTVVCDGLADLVAARRAGMTGVGLLTGGQPREELLRSGADLVLRDPADLRTALPRLGFPDGNSPGGGAPH